MTSQLAGAVVPGPDPEPEPELFVGAGELLAVAEAVPWGSVSGFLSPGSVAVSLAVGRVDGEAVPDGRVPTDDMVGAGSDTG
ncbi:hypothetical protein [Streptomyces prunicolor]|uniref:hypothetical protein n=1 Tax=Streptomyces prunicolor TaxID=67348 RepID=UPI0033C44584